MRHALLCLVVPCAALARPTGIFGYSGQSGAICNSCHSGGSTPTVAITGPSTLMSGASATYTLTISGGAASVGGLDVSQSGGATLIAGAGMRSQSNELTHSSPGSFSGSSLSFSFTVTAPSSAGTVTLYGAGLSANGNGSESGDKAAAATLDITVTSAAPPPPPMDAGSPPPPPPAMDAGSTAPPPSNEPPPSSDPGATQALQADMVMGGCSASGALPQVLLLVIVAIIVVVNRRRHP